MTKLYLIKFIAQLVKYIRNDFRLTGTNNLEISVQGLFMEVFRRKSSKITDGVMLGKLVGTNLTGVEANDLPAIKFYTPEGVESLPASFLSDEVGGGLDDLRKV